MITAVGKANVIWLRLLPNLYVFINHNNVKSNFKSFLLAAFKAATPEFYEHSKAGVFIDYLLDHHLIEETNIRRYTILKEFEIEYPKHQFHKTQTVLTIANKYELSEWTVWTVLKDHSRRFEK